MKKIKLFAGNCLGYAVYYLLMFGIWIGETLDELEEKSDATSRSLSKMQKYYKADETPFTSEKVLQAPQEGIIPFPVSRMPRFTRKANS